MASIPIQNETDYTLTDAITQEIIRDAHEHFGEEVRAIRVQSGLERHALNARTREVRYAFPPRILD
jgi:glucose-6-phosphate-specific signal transduction histidine kinase